MSFSGSCSVAACSQSSIHFCRFSRIWAPSLVGKALISRQELLKCPMPDKAREIAGRAGRVGQRGRTPWEQGGIQETWICAERRGGPEKLITSCRDRLTTSNAKLDPPCQAASW